jgi:hypothetical protein
VAYSNDQKNNDLLSKFDRLTMAETARFDIQRDPSVDDETKYRVRGKLIVICCQLSWGDCLNSHRSSDNNFDETITFTAAALELPFHRRGDLYLEPLKNLISSDGSHNADGVVLNAPCTEIDFVEGNAAAYIISRYEVVLKLPLAPAHYIVGSYIGPYVQSYGSAQTYITDERDFETRRWYYRLLKFPQPIENMYSGNQAAAKIEPTYAFYRPPAVHPRAIAVAVVQWPVAFTHTKLRFQHVTQHVETMEQRAARLARERADEPDGEFRSNPHR